MFIQSRTYSTSCDAVDVSSAGKMTEDQEQDRNVINYDTNEENTC